MDLKPIKTKRDYQAALKRAEQFWHAAAGSTEADRLDVLTLLIADYETRHFPIADPDPIQFLEYVMESRGLTRKDLEPYLGSRARVAEVLNRNRALTLEMIRRLSERLGLRADVLPTIQQVAAFLAVTCFVSVHQNVASRSAALRNCSGAKWMYRSTIAPETPRAGTEPKPKTLRSIRRFSKPIRAVVGDRY